MKRILVSVVAGFLLVTPLFASAVTVQELAAQIQALLAQIKMLQSASSTTVVNTTAQKPATALPAICSLTGSFGRGTESSDVKILQQFLADEGYLRSAPTGYFGGMTAIALAEYQFAHKLIAYRGEGGYFGSKTQQEMQKYRCTTVITCAPVNYTPSLCTDGTNPAKVFDTNGCLARYQCPNQGYVPPMNCHAWTDGCNECTRATASSTPVCEKNTCLATDATSVQGKGACTLYFGKAPSNAAPIFNSVSGPLAIETNTPGIWLVNATDTDNATVSYTVSWGDEWLKGAEKSVDQTKNVGENAQFTHTYTIPGTYTITAIAQDPSGGSTRQLSTVKVGGPTQACPTESAPVCAQPPEPACRTAQPACMVATPGPQTYTNTCYMQAAGAALLYKGECSLAALQCTQEVRQCPNGSFVSRSGPNCAFAECPIETYSGPPTCTTPWGNKVVNDGDTVGYRPYFTNGLYSSTQFGNPLMRCQNKSWFVCNTQGQECVPWTPGMQTYLQ